jgi:hypothetical protein
MRGTSIHPWIRVEDSVGAVDGGSAALGNVCTTVLARTAPRTKPCWTILSRTGSTQLISHHQLLEIGTLLLWSTAKGTLKLTQK